MSNTGDEDRHKGCAIQDGKPLGIQKQGAYDLGKQHCRQNMGHILLFVQEEAIAKGSDKCCQGKAGEKRTAGEQRCADEVGNHPCQPGANGPQKHPRKGDGHKGKADLQIPQIDGKKAGENDLYCHQHGHQNQPVGSAHFLFGHEKTSISSESGGCFCIWNKNPSIITTQIHPI